MSAKMGARATLEGNPPFVYFGTPYFSTFVLEELHAAGYMPALVVTTPDKPAGRGLELSASPVKNWAKGYGIPVLQPELFNDEVIATLKEVHAAFFVVAAYGKILPERVLEIPQKGCLNIHPSLLPRYRGTSPVETQILKDEQEVGVSVILMDAQMDHGPIVEQEKIEFPEWPIERDLVNERLWHAGGRILARVLPKWLAGSVTPTPQDHTAATLTHKIEKEDGKLNLNDLGRVNYLKYLAYEGWPGTFFFTERGGKQTRVKITKASLSATGGFVIECVVPEGKRQMSYEDFNRGN